MTVRLPRLALLAALALAGAPLAARAADAPAAASPPGASSAPAQCPARPTGTVNADADLAWIRQQLAAQAAASGEPAAVMLNNRGYNYGGDSGAVRIPGVTESEILDR